MGNQFNPNDFIKRTLNNRYQITRFLGNGALGSVYLARDTKIHKDIAIKVLTGSISDEDIKRFKRECTNLAKLSHPNIVGVSDHDKTALDGNNYYFLVMEYVNGATLKEFLKTSGSSLSLKDKLNIANQICKALNYTHEKEIIHRDLKPENVMIVATSDNDHFVKLVDFGISKSLSQDNQTTTTKSSVGGTARYISPEQVEDHKGKPITYNSDIYSLGIMFYEILSGQHPLIDNSKTNISDFNWASIHLKEPPRELSTICPDLPADLVDLVMKMLAKEPSDRPSLLTITSTIRNLLNPTQPPKPPEPPKDNLFNFETVKVNAKGTIIERYKKQAKQFIEDLGNGITLEMVEIPGGSFMMGSNEYKDEQPQHQVTVPGFYMGKYQVTQAQWKRVIGNNPSYFTGNDEFPVECVSWNEVVEFCKKLSEKTGKKYRLPSEAEWEYACRAGSKTAFAFGETITPEIVNYDGNYPYKEAPEGEYRAKTTAVGSLGVANEFGLYDMHGNVWEWCQDTWHSNYTGAPLDGSAWEILLSNNTSRVLRGGSYDSYVYNCRSADRYRYAPGLRYFIGFRVVMSARTLK